MTTIYQLQESVDTLLKQGFYVSLPNNRARVQSLLAGAILGLGQTLPADNILSQKQRFFYDLVDPSLNRFTRNLANKNVTSTPTLRTMTHAMVSLRLAMAHNPTELGNPIESLAWLTAKHDVPLFKDATLDVFKKLNISPFDIEIKHLFKAFVEADGNLYQTTMNGIETYCRRSYTRVNGTQVPLPSITEEELAIIAGGYLGILVAYVLSIPVTPVDQLDVYWAKSILPEVYGLVDQFNERAIMDVAHIEKVAKAIYFTRYNAIHQPALIAHTAVYLLLTSATSTLPPALLENMHESLRDQIADDSRDLISSFSAAQETHDSDSFSAIGFDRMDFIELDNKILESMEKDMNLMYALQDCYARGALSDSDVISLEQLHARYYNYTSKIPNVSLEDVRSGKYYGQTVSTEGVGLIIFGVVAAAITGAIFMAVEAIMRLFMGSKQVGEKINIVAETDKYIKNIFTQISEQANQFNDVFAEIGRELEEAIAEAVAKSQENATRQVRIILSAARRYNPQAKIPKTDVVNEGVKWILQNLNTPDKITALMYTRSDNEHVPQVSKAFTGTSPFANLKKHTDQSFESTMLAAELLTEVGNESILSKIIGEFKNGDHSKTLSAMSAASKQLTEVSNSAIERAMGLIDDTTAVNQKSVWEFTYVNGTEISSLFKAIDVKAKTMAEHLKKVKTTQERALRVVEDAVKSGKIDDGKGKQINDVLRDRIKASREVLVKTSRMGGIILKQEMTIVRFSQDLKAVVDNSYQTQKFIANALNGGTRYKDE